ncbi:MAG: protease modulator HflC [Hyphomicrobiales bacterium]|nr:protease modulator HflC [Hyphomicrobiales bacterium]
MNHNGRWLILALVAILVLVLIRSCLFTVSQIEEALVLRFGEPVAGRGLITTPGLHVKYPFIENVVFLDRRILDLESDKQEVLASDNQRLEVDAFLRYHIADPLKFYQTVQNVDRANNQLSTMLNSAMRRVLGNVTSTEIISGERVALMGKIRDEVNSQGARLGVAVNDVRIRRVDLPEQISEQVYKRMQSERAREAAEYRAKGAEQAQIIRAAADRQVIELKAVAQQQADTIRGAGDAKRAAIFAKAYGADPDFFAFYRSLRAYRRALTPSGTDIVLSPTSDFFNFFEAPNGAATKK